MGTNEEPHEYNSPLNQNCRNTCGARWGSTPPGVHDFKMACFSEPEAMFYAACVIEGLTHLHSKDICYRDLKPGNLVLDHNGYCKITDFGLSKEVKDKTLTFCGTESYMAPEMMTDRDKSLTERIGHNRSVDFWALGVLIYHMLCGVTPYTGGQNPQILYDNIKEAKTPKFPDYLNLSPEAKDIITRLLNKTPDERLGMGSGGTDELRKQDWFKGFDWTALAEGRMIPPMVPKLNRDLKCPLG